MIIVLSTILFCYATIIMVQVCRMVRPHVHFAIHLIYIHYFAHNISLKKYILKYIELTKGGIILTSCCT